MSYFYFWKKLFVQINYRRIFAHTLRKVFEQDLNLAVA